MIKFIVPLLLIAVSSTNATPALDGVTVGPNGEVSQIKKNASAFLIRRCENYTVVEEGEECTAREGLTDVILSRQDFINQLIFGLIYTGDVETNLQSFAGMSLPDSRNIERESHLARGLEKVKKFIERFGPENAQEGIKDSLENQLKVLGNSRKAWQGFEVTATRLVDDIIARPKIIYYRHSDLEHSVEGKALRFVLENRLPGGQYARVNSGELGDVIRYDNCLAVGQAAVGGYKSDNSTRYSFSVGVRTGEVYQLRHTFEEAKREQEFTLALARVHDAKEIKLAIRNIDKQAVEVKHIDKYLGLYCK